MFRKLIALSLLVVLAGTLVPGMAFARQGNVITIPIWRGGGTDSGQYVMASSDTALLYYYWYARDGDQVQKFMNYASFEVLLDDEPLFSTQLAAYRSWGPIESFTYDGLPFKRARWFYELPPLEPGEHTLHTIIRIYTEVNDGIAATPYQPGVVHNTTNSITVTEGVSPAAVVPEANEAPDDAAATPARPTPLPAEPEEIISAPAVGKFVATAEAYWAPEPDKLVDPFIEFQPGTTLWVFGMDKTRRYYKVLLDAAYLWVRVETMAPTADDVWANNPLPNAIVE